MKISIITVSYNSVKTIEQTIVSVINQIYADIEYIIVDGGSTDGTIELIKKYETYITKWISESDVGIYHAMNKGIKMATGDIVAFLNSDDWYELDALEYVNSEFVKGEYDIFFADVTRISEELKVIETIPLKKQALSVLHLGMPACHQGIFSKRELLQGGFNQHYSISADYDWLQQVMLRDIKVGVSGKKIAYFRAGGVSHRNLSIRLVQAREIALKYARNEKQRKETNKYFSYRELMWGIRIPKHKDLMKRLKLSNKQLYLFGTGIYGDRMGQILSACQIPIIGYLDNNANKWGTILHGCEIMQPDIVNRNDIRIIIAVKGHNEKIVQQLVGLGIDKDSIVTFRQFKELLSSCKVMEKEAP